MASTVGPSGYKIEPLNTLAFPKGAAPSCELTGLPASVQCITTHITLYYATREHAEQVLVQLLDLHRGGSRWAGCPAWRGGGAGWGGGGGGAGAALREWVLAVAG